MNEKNGVMSTGRILSILDLPIEMKSKILYDTDMFSITFDPEKIEIDEKELKKKTMKQSRAEVRPSILFNNYSNRRFAK